MHRSYVAEVTGGCLGAAMPDGMNLTVDTTERIEPLSLVCIVLKKSAGPWSSFMQAAWFEAMDGAWPGVMVKLYLGRGRANGRDVLLLGQLCPPCIGVVGLDEIEARIGPLVSTKAS